MFTRTTSLAALALAAWCFSFSASAQPMGKTKEYRSLNSDLYKVSIQKDGRIDITLASDTPVVTDIFPMVWFDGEDAPERMEIKGAWTERYLVEDKLGQGQGIHHNYKGTLWSLRAYPTRPYFAVQLAYTNETKKPVRIKALLPFCSGAPGKGLLTLGPGSENARILTGITTGQPALHDGAARGNDAVAVLNQSTGQSFIAGFLSQDRGHGQIDIGDPAPEDKKNPAGLRRMQAMTIYDEPIELAPGEMLESEVLYLAISETDPVVGLQRYARAVQVVHGLSGPEHDAPLHAWIINTENTVDIDRLTQQLRHAKELVPLFLINQVLIGSPTQPARTIGVDERIVEVARNEGFSPIIWYDPLAGGFDSISNASPDAQRSDGERIRRTYGQVSVAGIRASLDRTHELHPSFAKLREAIAAFREGLGPDARLFGAEPSLLAATLFDGVVSSAVDRRFLVPQPSRHAVYFDRSLGTLDAARAAISAATLTKCSLLIPLEALDNPDTATIAGRVLPSPQVAARPLDVFAQTTPRAFHLHTKTADGDVHVAAVMNWDGAEPTSVALPLARIGFAPGAYHSVYEYWQQKYLGTADVTLNVTIPAHGSTVLVFRPLLSRPMLATTGTNLGQDWPGLRTVEWSPQARTFTIVPEQPDPSGQFPLPDAVARYTLAVPQPYRLIRATSMSSQAPTWESANASATITFPSRINALQGFTAEFSTTP